MNAGITREREEKGEGGNVMHTPEIGTEKWPTRA